MSEIFENLIYLFSMFVGSCMYIQYLLADKELKEGKKQNLDDLEEEQDIDFFLNEEDFQNQQLEEEQFFIFQCGITQDVLREPFIDKFGSTYEKKMIVDWVIKKRTSPINRAKLSLQDLRWNINVRNAITYEILRAKYKGNLNNL
jgi:hypothetical protein